MIFPYEIVTGRKEKLIDLSNYKNKLRGKNILIAGVGSIGKDLVDVLSSFDVNLTLIDINEENLSKTRDILDAKEFKKYTMYLHDLKINVPIFGQIFDYIINTAAYKHVYFAEQNEPMVLMNNVSIARNLLNLSAKEKHILISTDKAVYPINVMGKTKRVCELLYLENIKGKVIRFGNVYGSSGSLVPRIKEGIEKGIVHVTDKNVTRFFMTIREATRLIIQAMFSEKHIDILDMGNPINIRKVINKMIEMADKPVKIKEIGLSKGEKLHEDLEYKKKISRYKFKVLLNEYKANRDYYDNLKDLEYDVI